MRCGMRYVPFCSSWLEGALAGFAVEIQHTQGATVTETKRSDLSENGIAALSYITFIPALLFLILPRYNKSAYVRFHAWQSLLLNVAVFLLSFVLTYLVMPFMISKALIFLAITQIIWAIWIGTWVVWAIAALNGKKLKLPLLGALAEKEAKAGN
jgi:uncharacterized membrane protein